MKNQFKQPISKITDIEENNVIKQMYVDLDWTHNKTQEEWLSVVIRNKETLKVSVERMVRILKSDDQSVQLELKGPLSQAVIKTPVRG